MMGLPTVLLLIIICIHLSHSQEEDLDPCQTAQILFNQYRRSVNYTAGSEGEPEEEWNNDRHLDENWYIFYGHQGQKIPNYPPGIGHCGAKYPIWLVGDLPTEGEGVVERETCVVGISENCIIKYQIKIKYCNETAIVYYLGPTNGEYEAYCIGDQLPCPEGEISDTGFTPGCTADFPILHNDPEISFRVHETPEQPYSPRIVVMLCDIEHNETDVFIDVAWYLGDIKVQEDTGENSIPYHNLPAELWQADWKDKSKLGQDLRCILKARYSKTEVPGPEKTAEYFMGFTIDERILEVEEGGEPDHVVIRPTIPVLCPVNEEDCELLIEVLVPIVSDGNPAACQDGRPVKQSAIKFDRTLCRISISMTVEITEETAFYMPVYASSDGVYDGDHKLALILKTPPTHHYHTIWGDYDLPVVHVTVIDKTDTIAGKYCMAQDDPFMVTMDGSKYQVQMEGEFVLYRHKQLPIEIQTYFQRVYENGNEYARVCGAAIRSGQDLFIYDHCREGEGARELYTECEEMGLVIKHGDNSVEVELPQGTKVYLSSTKVQIIPSLTDLDQIEGLCGWFDLICGNDFVGSDGTVFPDHCIGIEPDCSNVNECGSERMHDFAENWRVRYGSSLYQGEINNYRPMPDTIFCSCMEYETGDGEIEHITVCQRTTDLDFCLEGNVVIGPDHPCFKKPGIQDGTDNIIDEVGKFEYDRTYEAPEYHWRDGWTEAKARRECENFFRSLQAFHTCVNIPAVNFDTAIFFCMEAIKISANTDTIKRHASSVLTVCENEIKRNMSSFKFDHSTGAVEHPYHMLAEICPTNCNFQGICEKGVCNCNEGYFGHDCDFDINHVPTLYSIPQKGLCDIRSRPCQRTSVTGTYFLERSSLSCHIQPLLIFSSGEKSFQNVEKSAADYDHMERVMCTLPEDTKPEDTVAVGYIVAISNDGTTQSDKRNLVVFDSLCMNCTPDFHCVQKPNTCFIENACYTSKETKSSDPCLMCDPKLNDWNRVHSDTCNTPSNTGIIAGVAVAVIALVSVGAVLGVVVIKKKNKNRVKTGCEIELQE